jgi:3'(2'), 5'-bisphosphate nucleotidase
VIEQAPADRGAPVPRVQADTLDALARLARAAGEVILEVYARDFAVQTKGDDSPVTEADARAEAVIVAGLATLPGFEGWPVVAEESVAAGQVPVVGRGFWLVDPLDGTREFISRNGEFTVNIAWIVDGAPQAGVVWAPALQCLWAGLVGAPALAWTERGPAPQRRAIGTRPCAAPPVVVASRSHGDPVALRAHVQARCPNGPDASWRDVGSSLKFGLLAEGQADFYPRLSRTMEWDTAAGDAVLRAAGGRVCTLDGAPLRYGKPGFENPAFEAWGR